MGNMAFFINNVLSAIYGSSLCERYNLFSDLHELNYAIHNLPPKSKFLEITASYFDFLST